MERMNINFFLKLLFTAIILSCFFQPVHGQIESDKGPIFDYFRDAGYRIDFGFANVTAEGILGNGIRYRKGNSIVYLFQDGINGIAFEGDLTTPDIINFFERYESGINATPEIIGLSRTVYAIQNLALGNDLPDDVRLLNEFGLINTEPLTKLQVIAETDVQVISNVFKGIARPGAELNLDAKGQPVNPSFFVTGFAAKLGYTNFNWDDKIRLPSVSELTDETVDIRFLFDDLPIFNEAGEIIDALNGIFSGSSAEGINFASDLESLYNNFANEQGYGSEFRTLTLEGPFDRISGRIFEGTDGFLEVTATDDFRELTGILSPKGTLSKPSRKVKSFKSCGNPKAFPRDAVNSEINNFKFCGVQVTQRGESEWEFLGNVFKDNGLFKEELDDRAELAGKRYSNFLKINNDEIKEEVNSLNERLFNGEGNLPIGLAVSADITTKFSGLSTEYIRNFAEVTNRDLERLSKDINNRDIPGGPNAINDTEKEDNDDVQDFLDFLDGLDDDDDDDSNGRNNRNSIQNKRAFQNIAVTPEDFRNPDFFKELLATYQPSENKILEKVFLQALTIPNTKQGVAIGEGIYDAEQAELFQYTYLAATGAKSYLEAYMNHDVEALNTSDVWMDMLQQKDQGMYSIILEKLSEFYQSDRGLKDGSVFIAPQFTFGLEITPAIAISNTNDVTNLRVNDISYDIDVVLTAARLVLATDTDKDLKADLGIVLNKEELRFLLDTWAKDTNDDGLIDEGYLIWLQHKLQKTKQKLSKVIGDGQHEVFGSFNQILFPLAIAEFYKQQLTMDPSLRALSPELATLVDQDNLKTKDLLAKKAIYYDWHTSFQSKYVFENESKKGPSIPFIPSKAQVQWNPIAFEHTTTLPKKGTDVNHTHSRPTAAALAPTLSFSNPDVQLKPETLILGITSEGKLTLNNTTNTVIPPDTYILTTSTSEDIMYFNVLKFDVPEIPVGGKIELFFDYTPIAADSESGNREELRLHAASAFYDILFQRDFLIEENIMNGIDFDSFCEESTRSYATIDNETIVLAGENVLSGNTIESNGNLTAKGIESIDLVVGFDAKPGAAVELAITNCNEVQNIMESALQNNM